MPDYLAFVNRNRGPDKQHSPALDIEEAVHVGCAALVHHKRALLALARVSRLLRDKATCEKLRGTKDAEALYALLTESRETRAA